MAGGRRYLSPAPGYRVKFQSSTYHPETATRCGLRPNYYFHSSWNSGAPITINFRHSLSPFPTVPVIDYGLHQLSTAYPVRVVFSGDV